jgi:serine/threonine protein kinase/tetratricopeptide (TPR) repeat protein
VEVGDVIDGRFKVEAAVGHGGMGRVFRGIDRRDGRKVAIKVLQSASVENALRFEREVQILSKLAHDTIVEYRGHGVSKDGEAYLAMEWLDGEDLFDALEKAPLSVENTVQLGVRVSQALALSHAHGIVHRDIKPANIFLVEGDVKRLKVLDFGIARVDDMFGQSSSQAQLTHAGMIIGTVGYLSPEQARGAELTPRTDLFSLGAVLYVCLTQTPAFDGPSPLAVLAKIVADPVARVRDLVPGVPSLLDALIAKLLEKDPAARPPSAREVLMSLRELVGVVMTSSPPTAKRAVLSDNERRLVGVVLAGSRGLSEGTTVSADVSSLRERLDPLAAQHGAKIEVLADRSVLATLEIAGDLKSRVAQAARLSLRMRQILPGYPVVLTTGRVTARGAMPVGQAIDWASTQLDHAPREAIRTDRATARLLAGRFLVTEDQLGAIVHAEQTASSSADLGGRMGRCVGRDRELDDLVRVYDECTSTSSPRVAMIAGDQGLGKSRVLFEFLVRLSKRDERPLVMRGAGDGLSAGAPYAMLGQAIRDACGIDKRASAGANWDRIASTIARAVPEEEARSVAAFIAALAGVETGTDDPELERVRGDAQELGGRMRSAFARWIEAEATKRPVIVALEDAHNGDRPTFDLLEHTLRTVETGRVFVVATARTEIGENLPELFAGPRSSIVALGPLARQACVELAREALGSAADPELLQTIASRSAGNARFLEELIRAAARGQRDTLPDTIAGTVEAEITALGQAVRRAVRAASVFGQSFTVQGVAALLDEPPDVVGSYLQTLVKAEIATRADGADGGYAFRHALLREVAYEMLTAEDRAEAHRRAASWLESIGTPPSLVLAEHYERSGDREHAVHALLHVAHEALAGNDFSHTISYAERAIGLGARGGIAAMLRLHAAEAQTWSGRPAAAMELALGALDGLPPGSAEWCQAASVLTEAAANVGRRDVAEEWAAKLRHAAWSTDRGHEGDGAPIRALARSAAALVLAGSAELGRAVLDEVEYALVNGGGADLVAAAHYHFGRANVFALRGDHALSVGEYSRAAELYQRAAYFRFESVVRANIGYALIELGAYEEGVTVLSEVLKNAETLGIPFTEALARHNLGIALALTGRVQDGYRVELEALDDYRAQGDVRFMAAAHLALAQIVELDGKIPEAERHAQEAVRLTHGSPAMRACALGWLAHFFLLQGRAHEGLAAATDGMNTMRRYGIESSESLLRLVHAQGLAAVGQVEEARYALRDAVRRLDARAYAITEGPYRESFLNRIGENVRTRALANEWGV